MDNKWKIKINFVPFESEEKRTKCYKFWVESLFHSLKVKDCEMEKSQQATSNSQKEAPALQNIGYDPSNIKLETS